MRQLPVLLLLLSLVACTPFVKDGQPVTTSTGVVLQAGETVGQTVLARDGGLQGIEVFLEPMTTTGDGKIQLHLRNSPRSPTDLASSTLAVQSIAAPGWFRFTFSPPNNSGGEDYYFVMELQGAGQVRVGTAAGDTYLDGALYQNESPVDAQMTFRLVYEPGQLFLGLLAEVGSWFGILSVAIFILILPGWALLTLLWPGWDIFSWGEKLGVAGGVSLALYPLLFLWTDMIGLHLGALYAWLPGLTGLGILLWQYFRDWKIEKANPKRTNEHSKRSLGEWLRIWNLQLTWPNLTLLAILAIIFATRFWVIRSLNVPMWGDSYQHTMIAQLLVDNNGLFNSWQPYAELTTFTYHFGFHSVVAVFDWITHVDMTKAVLLVGQLLNVLAVMVLYPLATKIGRNQWAGVVAVFVAGLLLPMPMFYVNWGRYTQLAGQVILPVAVWLIWNTLTTDSSSNKAGWGFNRMLIISCVTLGGLALTHYRVLIFAILFLVTLWILYARRETVQLMLLRTFLVAAGAVLLFIPWFIHVFSGRIFQIFSRQMTTSAIQAVEVNPQLTGIGNIFVYLPSILWLILPVLIGCGIWRREKGLILISLWWYANMLAANPSWLGLPGSGVLDNFTVFIAAYIPAGIIVGVVVSWLDDRKNASPDSQSKIYVAFFTGVVILFIAVGFWGIHQRLNDIQPSKFTLATHPDILAALWIQKNIDPEAHLLVNSFPAFSNSVIVGSDGGWWLPLLARRQITVPPINYVFEHSPWPGYRDQINSLTFEIQTKGIQDPSVLSELRNQGISYIYIGQRQGWVNSGGPLFTAEQLLADPSFRLIYHQDRVWIFQIQQMP